MYPSLVKSIPHARFFYYINHVVIIDVAKPQQNERTKNMRPGIFRTEAVRTGGCESANENVCARLSNMSQSKVFDDLSIRIREMLAATPAKDVEKNLRTLLSGFFARLDLVSREEFDAQAKVLARTREKLAALEARVAEMERQSGG